MKRCLITIYILWSFILSAGCTNYNPNTRPIGSFDTYDPEIVFQICLPTKFERETIGLKSVYRTSTIAGNYNKIGMTLNNQSVYEQNLGEPGTAKALIVRMQEYFVFLYPKDTIPTQWTKWIQPDFSSTDSQIDLKVMYKKPIEKGPIDASAPLIRYKKTEHKEWSKYINERHGKGPLNDLPPC